ncbi:hypothetical protein [Actinoallomurus acanthiterrae]
MYTGLALTVIATIVPYVDRATTHLLADHIRAGYPTYTQTRVDSAVTAYLVLLSVVGALGVIAWLWTTWAVKAGKRWARPTATVMFVLGTSVGLAGLLIKDTSGDTGLSPALGWAWRSVPGRPPGGHAAVEKTAAGVTPAPTLSARIDLGHDHYALGGRDSEAHRHHRGGRDRPGPGGGPV